RCSTSGSATSASTPSTISRPRSSPSAGGRRRCSRKAEIRISVLRISASPNVSSRSADGALWVVTGWSAGIDHRLEQLAAVLLHVAVEELPRFREPIQQPLRLAPHL